MQWRIRLHHTCTASCIDDPPHRDGAFPWWKPSSYTAFWRIAGRDYYWPALVTIWHREPGGHDALSVCRHRTQRPDGTWYLSSMWRLHVHHWRPQIHPLQRARRWLLTRCTICGGRSTKAHPISLGSWNGRRAPWYRGEVNMRHMDCAGVNIAGARG